MGEQVEEAVMDFGGEGDILRDRVHVARNDHSSQHVELQGPGEEQ